MNVNFSTALRNLETVWWRVKYTRGKFTKKAEKSCTEGSAQQKVKLYSCLKLTHIIQIDICIRSCTLKATMLYGEDMHALYYHLHCLRNMISGVIFVNNFNATSTWFFHYRRNIMESLDIGLRVFSGQRLADTSETYKTACLQIRTRQNEESFGRRSLGQKHAVPNDCRIFLVFHLHPYI